ncbi:ATP-binding protein [Streptomyces sp. DSM 42041]|uniref:ATP-binding protein n=1 Tax=Streptomyces hazeniae TaxID=3075538 RepID=A0ABU2NQV9_9ACTN|nr:ATP-binding protein [Streptomyces sp. DSM 42041]MDT0378407.1 ATP-binding protein [Streptomyces sp. DSM 42041]
MANRRRQAAYENAFPADVARLSGVRRLTTAHARLWGLDTTAVDDAELIVDELFTNAVRHGSRTGDHVTLSLVLDGPELHIAVGDTGRGTPQRHIPGPGDESGRGLFLIDALAAKWGVDHVGATGQRTWAVLTLPSRPAGRDPQTAA